MPASLLQTISSYITPDIINKASSFLGETPASASMAMAGIVPTLLSSMATLASGSSGLSQLESLLSKVRADGGTLDNLGSLFSGGTATTSALGVGRNLLRTILGGNTVSLVSAVSRFSGISSSSAGFLLSLAAPLVLGTIAKLKYAQTLSTGEVARLLVGQKGDIAGAVPSALSSFFPATSVAAIPTPAVAQEDQKRSSWSWLALI